MADKDNKPSEADAELERMFGPKEEQTLDIFQKQKLWMVQGAYQ